jgi:hypothetical protein
VPVSITDGDVHNLRVTARAKVSVAGEVVFDGPAPEKPVTSKLNLWLQPLARGQWMGEELQLRAGAPDKFAFAGLFVDDYNLRTMGLPDGTYVKDITYGGASILHEPLRVGSAMGEASLRIILARDGAVLTAKVADKEGRPVTDAWVYAIPADAASEAEVADRLVSGQTDQDGVFNSKPLAPGKYSVIAGTTVINKTPESIARLANSRNQATEIDLSPGAVQTVTLIPKIVD